MADKGKHASKAAYDEGDLYSKVNWDEVPDPVEDAPADEVVELIKKEYGDYVIGNHRFRGDRTVTIKRDGLVEIAKRLKDDENLKFNFLMDLTAADYPENEYRFEVVYHFFSYEKGMRLRLKVPLKADDLWIETLTSLYETANWFEREVMEFFGITFKHHPDPRKLFLYDEFKGFPLRKDYPYNKRQPLIEYRDVGVERHHFTSMRGSGTDIDKDNGQ